MRPSVNPSAMWRFSYWQAEAKNEQQICTQCFLSKVSMAMIEAKCCGKILCTLYYVPCNAVNIAIYICILYIMYYVFTSIYNIEITMYYVFTSVYNVTITMYYLDKHSCKYE